MLVDADILFGKLALGRRCITREDARRLVTELASAAQMGRQESLSQTAVRLGYIAPAQAQALTQVLETGSLICRGTCGRTFKLSGLTAQDTSACPDCRGHLYVAREEATAPAASSVAPEGGTGGVTVMDLEFEAVDMSPPGPPPDSRPKPPDDGGAFGDEAAGKTFLDLDLDMPTPGGADPGASSPPSTAPTQPSSPSSAEQLAPGGTLVLDDGFGDLVAEARAADAPEESAAPGGTIVLEPGSVPTPGELEAAEKTVEMSGSGWQEAAFEPFAIAPGLEIVAPIGVGGMGSVYRARRASGEMVAVKVLTQQGSHLPEVLERFRREVKLSSGLQHPNIVNVYEAGLAAGGEHEGRPFFAMDFVHGRDLSAWARERSRSHTEIVRIMLPVCDAIHYAHGRGVVHRDLKPGNVLVSFDDDHPMVCDFGLAKVASAGHQLTQTGDIIGTPNYMPPEQAMGNRTQIGPPTDVYALGAILYFLLTGRPPFTGPTAFSVIDKLMRSPLEVPSSLEPSVTPALEQVVTKALAKKPVERFHTCQELGQALQAAVR